MCLLIDKKLFCFQPNLLFTKVFKLRAEEFEYCTKRSSKQLLYSSFVLDAAMMSFMPCQMLRQALIKMMPMALPMLALIFTERLLAMISMFIAFFSVILTRPETCLYPIIHKSGSAIPTMV